MTESNTPVLSVRGEARQTVTPDSVVLSGALTATAASKPDALRQAAAALDSLQSDLRSLEGVPLTPDTQRQPLTWSAYSAATHPEGDHDPKTGGYTLTGRVTAAVALNVAVRDFRLLDPLGALLAQHEGLAMHHASWNVDADNPAWPEVRAAAIHSAIRKGRDYAAALGGSLRQVLHIADAGLLGGDGSSPVPMSASARFATALSASAGPGQEGPSLDPVPQELSATIEARFTTTGISLVED